MPSGNGAYIVHAELSALIPRYQLQGCNPYLASIPGLPSRTLRQWLGDAEVVHLSPNTGHIPLPPGRRRVLTFHSFDIDPNDMEQASSAQRFYYRNVLRLAVIAATKSADRLVAVSKFVADCVRRHCPVETKPVEVIYNGIDTQRFRPSNEVDRDRPLRVLFVGNPTRRKGFHLLAELAEQLPDGVELAFTSGLRDEQAKAAHKRLVPLGQVPYSEMHRLYQQADILLFPAYREGCPLCVAEAMASGLPIVSSNCSGIPELIDEGRGGFLVAPGDLPAMLERTCRLLASAELRRDMGKWNRARAVRDFDRARMAKGYHDLFASLS
jgi:glycosyltransferase involved in cell wall biosynthesis